MTCEDRHTGIRCANEGCPRETEPGERYCVSCGLERALYKREARRPAPPAPGAGSGREAERR